MCKTRKRWMHAAKRVFFVGYDKGSPAYLVYFPETNVVKRIRCVKFTEKFERTNEFQLDNGIVRTEKSEYTNKSEHDEN